MDANILSIDGEFLRLAAKVDNLTIADSFVKKDNKVGAGSGEAKLYVGHSCAETWNFFGPPSFEINCFILKKDLLNILETQKKEYLSPTQAYKASKTRNFYDLWLSRLEKITQLKEILWFQAYEQEQIKGARVYIKSDSSYFDLIREICLPNITKLSIEKYLNKYDQDIFRFYPKTII